MTATTHHQYASCLDKRAASLRQLAAEIQSKLPDTGAEFALHDAIEALEEAARCLRGKPKSPAQLAQEAHQPGLPPGGGQPDLF